MGKPEMRLSPDAARVLMAGNYPGNARELQQIMTNAVIISDGSMIHAGHLGNSREQTASDGRTLSSLKENEEAHIVYVLEQTRGDRKEACRILGVSLRQLQRKIAALRNHPRWRGMVSDR
jgi:DNA-binding NtrC family response regulator